MESAIHIVQIITAILLITVVLIQVRGQGGGLFGSSESTYRTRRGIEKTLFQFTIVLVVVFLTTSIVSVRIF
jgi:preprotein translocase subunit SecG